MKEKIINFRYVFYPFLAFFLGITIARKLFAGNLEIILLALGLFVIATVFLSLRKAFKPLIILFAFFFLGNGFYFLGETSFSGKEYSSPVAVIGRVTDDLVDYGYSKVVVLDNVKINGENANNLRLTIKNSGEIDIGANIAFEGIVERSKPFSLNSFNSADLRDGVRYQSEVSYANLIITEGFLKIDEAVRLSVKSKLYQHMSERNAGISYAVLFGDKSGVDELTENAYKNSGIIHVLTVSGLHVGFLISLVYFLLKLCKANKIVRFIITSIFIFFYAFLCGFSPSVMRAGVMAMVLMIARILGRRYDSLNSLGVAGFVLCLFSPLTALDIGFQMSFFCIAGIIMLSPILTRLFSKFIPNKIASLLALSISAQVGLLPITAVFGVKVSFLSIFANLLVVPAFSVIYPFLFLISFLSTIIPFIGPLLSIADYSFIAVNAIANFFGSAIMYFELSSFKSSITALYFIAIMIVGKFVMTKALAKFALFSVVILLATVTFGLYLVPTPATDSVAIVGNKTSSSVIVENKLGERLVVGNNYLLGRYLSAYDVKKVDGFIALKYMGDEDMGELSEKGVQNFFGNKENEGNKGFVFLEDNTVNSIGAFKICFIVENAKTLGVGVTYEGNKIFVASSGDINYNSNIIEEFSPNLVIGQGKPNFNRDITFVSTNSAGENYFSLVKDGNMKLIHNGNNWSMRGID